MQHKINLERSNTMPIMDCFIVNERGESISTNLEEWLITKDDFDLEPGVYDIKKAFELDKLDAIQDAPKESLDSDQFPPIPPKIPDPLGELIGTRGKLKVLFQTLLKFSSQEETRYYLNGAFIDQSQFVATNGHIICAIDHDIKHNGQNIVLPNSFMKKAVKLLAKNPNSQAILRFNKLRCELETENNLLIGKIIDCSYPNWRLVLPKPGPKQAIPNSLLDSIKLHIAKNGKKKAFYVDENFNNVEKESAIAAYNPDYLIKIIQGGAIQIASKAVDNAPLLFEGNDSQFVIMPIQIKK